MVEKTFDPEHELRIAADVLSVLVIGESSSGRDLAQIRLVEDAYLTKTSDAFDEGTITFDQYGAAVRLASDEHYPENPFTLKRNEVYSSYEN